MCQGGLPEGITEWLSATNSHWLYFPSKLLAGLPSFNICDIANIIDVKPFIPDLGDLFQKPNFTLPQVGSWICLK